MEPVYYLVNSKRKKKRYALITPKNKIIHFGSKKGQTYIDHGDKTKRTNYIKRHSKLNETWTEINPASLSALILWGPNKDIDDNIEYYEREFGINIEDERLYE